MMDKRPLGEGFAKSSSYSYEQTVASNFLLKEKRDSGEETVPNDSAADADVNGSDQQQDFHWRARLTEQLVLQAAFELQSWEELVAAVGPGEALLRVGQFEVCRPLRLDVKALRIQEQELVEDNRRMYEGKPWYEQLRPADWYDLVSVIFDEQTACRILERELEGCLLKHLTLQCVHTAAAESSNSPSQREVVGFVHIIYRDAKLEIAHLKVAGAYKRRGVGAMLLAGAMKLAQRMNLVVREFHLLVAHENAPARAFYGSLGFAEICNTQQHFPVGDAVIGWIKLSLSLPDSSMADTIVQRLQARSE